MRTGAQNFPFAGSLMSVHRFMPQLIVYQIAIHNIKCIPDVRKLLNVFDIRRSHSNHQDERCEFNWSDRCVEAHFIKKLLMFEMEMINENGF
jgi:hypothetical protein